MLNEEFSDGQSLIHQLDPRVKIVAAAAFSIVTAALTRYPALGMAACMAIVSVLLARLQVRPLVRRLAPVNFFLLLLWLILPLTTAAAAPLHIGPIGIEPKGFLLALVLTVKSNAIVLACIALLATHSPADIARALNRLHMPAKMVQILFFMLRYLSEIRREYGWMKAAMSMRGFQARTDLNTYKNNARLVGLLLVLSYEKAELIQAAMLCRGFHGHFHAFDESSFEFGDAVFAVATAAVLVFVILLQWMPLT